LLFLKLLDDLHTLEELKATRRRRSHFRSTMHLPGLMPSRRKPLPGRR
jgi:hypothetical protein